jgi:hypothetical protein
MNQSTFSVQHAVEVYVCTVAIPVVPFYYVMFVHEAPNCLTLGLCHPLLRTREPRDARV